ncbi:hypothetical protein K505DRAFT_365216 [Melanomma pulvis-pyrius CBS 109.77]|uniref:MARVEL domain-containing protein n=1 Tax=Melanomma pulvis-pyrius CBS 109.77 TaxID=1314802 RepID=A0A6A6X152_9PLEO|nr:hypothetical protein K505DRAFT_365216 [Melanomma pulvis-pyrius CBS 109.77]
MPSPQVRPLDEQILRTAGLFQALAAFPIAFFLGSCAWFALFDTYSQGYFYYFFADSMTALMAAGIIFVVIVQRKVVATKLLTLQFEAGKTVLATGLWVWLMLDSALGRWSRERVPRATMASILLVLFFYPVLGYAIVQWKVGDEEDRSVVSEERAERGESEQTPLLSG